MSSLNSQSDNTVDEHIIDEAKQSGISEKEAKNIIEEEEGIELLQVEVLMLRGRKNGLIIRHLIIA